MRDSLVVYKSTVDVVKTLSKTDRLKFYESLFEYALNDVEPEGLDGTARAFFDLTRPLIDSNNKKYKNGLKGGRPKNDNTPRKVIEGAEYTILTEAEYEALLNKYGDKLLGYAITEINNWLALPTKNAEQARGKDHYAYFRTDGWVLNNARDRMKKETGINWSV